MNVNTNINSNIINNDNKVFRASARARAAKGHRLGVTCCVLHNHNINHSNTNVYNNISSNVNSNSISNDNKAAKGHRCSWSHTSFSFSTDPLEDLIVNRMSSVGLQYKVT